MYNYHPAKYPRPLGKKFVIYTDGISEAPFQDAGSTVTAAPVNSVVDGGSFTAVSWRKMCRSGFFLKVSVEVMMFLILAQT